MNMRTGTHEAPTIPTRTGRAALVGLAALSSVSVGDVLAPVSFDFGTEPSKTTHTGAGFTLAGGPSASATDQAQNVLLDRINKTETGFQNVGLLRTFTGLGSGETNDFIITTRFILSDLATTQNNERFGIHLFADTSDNTGLGSGLSLKLRGTTATGNSSIEMGAGIESGALANAALGYDLAAGDSFVLTVAGTFTGADLKLDFSIARNGEPAQTITRTFNTATDALLLDGTFCGISTRIKNPSAGAFGGFSLLGGPSTQPPVLTIMPNMDTAGSYDFSWSGKSGRVYDLVSSTDFSAAISTWTIWDGKQGLYGTPPNNVLVNIPGGGDQRRFFALVEQVAPPLIAESFDAAAQLPAGWSSNGPVGGTDWEAGVPSGVASGPASAFTAPHCVGTNIAGYYNENADVSLKSPVLAIPAGNGATLRFRQFIDTDGLADFGAVRILDADNANAPIAGLAISAIQGVGGAWTQKSLEMPAQDVAGKNIRIEFNFTSNPGAIPDSEVFSGFYVDDVFVTLK
jgi:hypothetical protein